MREFVEMAAAQLGFSIEWRGAGVQEEGVDRNSGRVLVRIDPRYFRPTEVESLLGDSSKARSKLGWQPETGFEALVQEMVEADLELAKRDALMKQHGFKVYHHHE